MQRKNIVAGNWKMNTTYEEGLHLAKQLADSLQPTDTIVVLGTPFIHLSSVGNLIKDAANLKLAAQNCYYEDSGAYTGEVSVPMLKSVGVEYVILGHSERREYFYETDDLIAKKVDAVLKHGLTPIYCCGEVLAIREAGNQNEHVGGQLTEALFHLSPESIQKIVIAYEPVWAIGTGKTATPEQAQEMHAYIRQLLADKYGKNVADSISILYGGSVKANNAKELFSQLDVDGGLVGGASLDAAGFVQIVESI